MSLTHPRGPARPSEELSLGPLFTRERDTIPRHELPEGGMDPDVAYQVIHDELMLDGNARMNLATFVTTWMEPQAEKLMAECFDKNMIDKDEYPQTAELETRCVAILQTVSDESRLIVSEPLGDVSGAWNEVPESSCVVVEPGTDELLPFAPIPVQAGALG